MDKETAQDLMALGIAYLGIFYFTLYFIGIQNQTELALGWSIP